mgnify:CR=1 FL=1
MATVRYFAGARDAAGTETETVDATTVGELHAAVVARPAALAAVPVSDTQLTLPPNAEG